MSNHRWTSDPAKHCHCCGRAAHRFGPLHMTDKGWTCGDTFCKLGTKDESTK